MNIILTEEDYKKLKDYKLPEGVIMTTDPKLEVSVIMVQVDGKFLEWHRGFERIESYLRLGYGQDLKYCPFLKKKCIGIKCARYIIQNGTGDCVDVWNYFKK